MISYPSHKDGYIFSYYKYLLSEPYEREIESRGISESIVAFRKTRRDNVDLANSAFEFISSNTDLDIYTTDVQSYFDRIDHRLLKLMWSSILETSRLDSDHHAVYKALTQYGYVRFHEVYNKFRIPIPPKRRPDSIKRICRPREFREKVIGGGLWYPGEQVAGKGIPQGSSLSPFLSNLYLLEFDTRLHELSLNLGGKYWRYCDDVLFVAPKGSMDEIESEIADSLSRMKLVPHPKKTVRSVNYSSSVHDHINHKPVQYLGFEFDGKESWIRASSLTRYRRKVKKGIRAAKVRRSIETAHRHDGEPAALRRQSLLNMYSGLSVRGTKIRERNKKNRYTGNFISYMNRAAAKTGSKKIRKQIYRMWIRLQKDIQNAS